jgi:hypothetical protein
MLQARSPFWALAKNRTISPPPPSRQGRLFPLRRGNSVISLSALGGSLPQILLQAAASVKGEIVEYDEVSNKGKTSAENLKVQRSFRLLRPAFSTAEMWTKTSLPPPPCG